MTPEPEARTSAGLPLPNATGAPGARWTPWVTYALIGANLVVFAWELAAGAGASGPDPQGMIALGGNFAPLTAGGQPWRLVSAMFLHYGVVHVGMNMVCLYQIAPVERALGRAEFVALYVASGLVGGLASLVTHPQAVSAGASGAVFGMFGAFAGLMLVRRKQIERGAWQRTMRSLTTFFALNLALGLSQASIDLSAHLGGLMTGFLGGSALAKTRRAGVAGSVGRALVVAVLGAAIAFGGLRFLVR